jgi:hypothetical protein
MALKTEQSTALTADFDADADVLYISLGAPVASHAEEAQGGLLLRRSTRDDQPSGVTAIDFRQNWRDQRPVFYALVAEFLGVPAETVERTVEVSI